ncbi:MAG: hypothetical protein GF307_04605 [candidate division Zixibacteria bacterium]|nr:hypothetical protein [candidate division Zixibacteria bacterium]
MAIIWALLPNMANAEIRKVYNPPIAWMGASAGYLSGPNFGNYRDYLNNYYNDLGSSERISNFGGGAAFNLELKNFFSSHFAYGLFFTAGNFNTDQIFNFRDNGDYQVLEEYQLKYGQFGADFSFSPVDTRRSRLVPYVTVGGLLSSGVLDVLYSEDSPNGRRSWSYNENTFDIGYRFGAGLVFPVSTSLALHANSFYSYSRLKFNADFDPDEPINIKGGQWFTGVGIVYLYK